MLLPHPVVATLSHHVMSIAMHGARCVHVCVCACGAPAVSENLKGGDSVKQRVPFLQSTHETTARELTQSVGVVPSGYNPRKTCPPTPNLVDTDHDGTPDLYVDNRLAGNSGEARRGDDGASFAGQMPLECHCSRRGNLNPVRLAFTVVFCVGVITVCT